MPERPLSSRVCTLSMRRCKLHSRRIELPSGRCIPALRRYKPATRRCKHVITRCKLTVAWIRFTLPQMMLTKAPCELTIRRCSSNLLFIIYYWLFTIEYRICVYQRSSAVSNSCRLVLIRGFILFTTEGTETTEVNLNLFCSVFLVCMRCGCYSVWLIASISSSLSARSYTRRSAISKGQSNMSLPYAWPMAR